MEVDSKITEFSDDNETSRMGALPVGERVDALAASNSGISIGMELYSAAIKILNARKFPAGTWRV